MKAGQKILSIILMLAAASASLSYPINLSASEAGAGEARVLVRLRDPKGEVIKAGSRRWTAREVRLVSRRAPREYEARGQRKTAVDLRHWRVVTVPVSELEDALEDLRGNKAVAEARVEQIYRETVAPNDPYFDQQYGLFSTSQPLADINAKQAWDKTTGSAETIIAVIDGGVDLTQADLQAKIWRNPGEAQGNGQDDDGNGFIDDVAGWDFVDSRPAGYAHAHATHVAGIAAADGNNGVGVAGVDWQARIMSVRVLNRYGLGREGDIAAGIDYATANGAKIINLSLAGGRSAVIEAAIENAYAAGVVVVAAAGNQGGDTGVMNLAPVCSETAGVNMVLGVGATDEDGEPASFSNWGKCVDVSAPGRRIISTVPGNRYRQMSGTSMSAPLAAGVAGLYLALHPGAGPAEVIAAMKDGHLFAGSKAAQWNDRYKGRLDAARVLGVEGDDGLDLGPTPSPSQAPDSGQFVLVVTRQGPAEAAPGSEASYQVRVENTGAGPAAGVVVEDSFDRDLRLVGEKSSGGCVAGSRTVRCEMGSLAAGESKQVELVYGVDESARCGSRSRDRAAVYALERGRSRRQAVSERVETRVVCR